MYGDDTGMASLDQSKTKITTQQKTKFIMHWFILLTSLILIFWYYPIKGNFDLYSSPICDEKQYKFYGCKNFHKNPTLRVLFILVSLYLMFSALQLSYGFSIMRKPSSVMAHYGPLPNLGCLIYAGIPMLTELRCTLDFTMSNTSLDLFQFFQLWVYHQQLFNSKNGNLYYV
jgi:hypothetical protein